MAKYRTKKDRLRAKEHRSFQSKTRILENLEQSEQGETIFSYNPKLIVKDLKKTFFLVIFILLVLLSIALIYT